MIGKLRICVALVAALLGVGIACAEVRGSAFGGPNGTDFVVDGRVVQIRAGEIHPQRIPAEYWRHRVQMCKAMGLNAISSYFMWNDFEQPDGSFDFGTGNRDVADFMRIVKEEGMWLLFRPGPYACAEWDFGGIPPRYLKGNAVVRSSDPRYLAGVEKYLSGIAEIAEPFLAKNGGPIILVQIENEYGSWPFKDTDYLKWLKAFWKARGFGPLYMADGAGDRFLKDLIYPDREIAVGFDPGTDDRMWAFAAKYNPNTPVMSSETYPGWLRHWGEGNWKPSNFAPSLKWLMAGKRSFALYMAHGGTSFGFHAGANDGGPGKYQPDVTSYDYAAPIDERGAPTPEYFVFRRIISETTGETPPDVPDPIPAMDIPAFTPAYLAPLRANCERPMRASEPPFFESFGQNQGMAIYRATVPAGEEAELGFVRIADYAQIWLDGVRVATIDRRLPRKAVRLPARDKPAILEVVVEAMGHVNFGAGMPGDRKGLLGPVTLGGVPVHDWTVTPKPLTEASVAAARPSARDAFAGGHFRGTFRIGKTADTFLDMSRWTKGTVYVNGRNLGRYWKVGPQYSLYCPASWLKAGENTIDVLDLEQGDPQPVRGLDRNLVVEKGVSTCNADNVW